jgi:glutamate-5-semialdehyde dehydrogenase
MSIAMPDYVTPVAEKARAAARVLGRAATADKNAAIKGAAEAIRGRAGEILSANAKDVAAAKDDGKPAAFIDRLALDEGRVEGIAAALDALIALPDPVGRVLHTEKRPNGLEIRRVATPLGVIGIIYESRPNVAADAGALCLKSGNAVILRGGSDSVHSTGVIVECLQDGLKSAGLPAEAVQTLGTTDRAAVAQMLRANGLIDLIIPRGGKGLTSLVMEESRVPTLLHLDGNNHVYVHESADLNKAVEVVKNAKLRRTGVCGAAETVVVDRKVASDLLPKLADALEGCELRGEDEARGIEARIKPATEQDWDTESRCHPGGEDRRGHRRGAGLRLQALLRPHRGDHRRGRGRRETLPGRDRQRHRDAQRLHPVRRWGRVRDGRGDRHRHGPPARPRTGRPRTAQHLQIPGARQRPDPRVRR